LEKTAVDDLNDYLASEPHVLGLFIAVLLINLGEQLWAEFIPAYFIALGGSVFALGVFKSLSDALAAVAQLPGGIISDRLGRINASIFFFIFGITGYVIYFISESWILLFVGLIFIQGTSNLLQPTIFSIIGDWLPPTKRTNAFSVQSILKRLPIIVSPLFGGFLIGYLGTINGVKTGLVLTIIFSVLGIIIIWRSSLAKENTIEEDEEEIEKTKNDNLDEFNSETKTFFQKNLVFLLIGEIFARFGQAMVKFFIALYVIDLFQAKTFGFFIGIQMTVAILSYLPAAYIAERMGRKPVIIVTFVCFSIYPALILLSSSYYWILFGFVIMGLKEFGEPARKALIVNFSRNDVRGKNIGLYYTIRSSVIIPAGIAGSLLWIYSPQILALTASGIAFIGLLIFTLLVNEVN